MGRKRDKLLDKLYSKPKDFKWSELQALLKGLGYEELQGSGSRVKFYLDSPRSIISLHKPHPEEALKPYMIKYIIESLKEIGVYHGDD